MRLGVASLSKAHTSDRAPTASVPIAHGCNCPPCTSSPSFLCSTRRVQSGTAIKACLGLQARNLAARGSTTNSPLIRRTTRTSGLIRQLAVSALQRRIPRSPHRHRAWVASSPRGTRAAWPRWVQPMRFAGAGCPRRCQRRAFPHRMRARAAPSGSCQATVKHFGTWQHDHAATVSACWVTGACPRGRGGGGGTSGLASQTIIRRMVGEWCGHRSGEW